jgi:hypothetical protein
MKHNLPQRDLMMDELKTLVNRLKRIGIEIKCTGNVPWIYLSSVNGNQVKETGNGGNHGFTIAWYKDNGTELHSNMKGVFELIRKYN